MAAPAATVIEGVSLLHEEAPEEDHGNGDLFDVGLSPDGVEVRRPGRSGRQLSWDKVSEWTIEARPDGVLLTLRSRSSSVIRLVIPCWAPEDLDAVLRDVTSRGAQSNAHSSAESSEQSSEQSSAPSKAESETTPHDSPSAAMAAQERVDRARGRHDATRERAPAHARDGRRHAGFRVTWKAVGTILLLAVLATAVTLVLLQSAGIISWGFLGPTA